MQIVVVVISVLFILSACTTTSVSSLEEIESTEPTEETGATAPSDSQATEIDKLVGTWTGTWWLSTRQWDVTMQFEVSQSQELVGTILYYTGVAYNHCTGAKIDVRKKTVGVYEIDVKSADCWWA